MVCLRTMQASPMLSNPPALVLLALVVALGAYLRSVAEAASKMIDEIDGDEHPNSYPLGKEWTDKKLVALANTREKLNGFVAPAMIGLSILTTIRLLLQSISLLPNFPEGLSGGLDVGFRVFDVLAFLVLVVAFSFLGMMHRGARETDKAIRDLIAESQKTPKVAVKI